MIDDGSERVISPDERSKDEPKLKLRDRLNKMNADSIVGTYYYMAPEVLQGATYNATADWFFPFAKSHLTKVVTGHYSLRMSFWLSTLLGEYSSSNSKGHY